jgi:C4-dicarboxylate-specific signal transduction histidine kinase
LLPRPRDALAPRERAETTAWWALDISEARAVIGAIVGGKAPGDWVTALLAGVRIADVDQNNVQLLGPYGGRARMVGQPFMAMCPPESWQVGAELILAAAADYPYGAARLRQVTSLAFRDTWARASTDPAHPDIVFIAVGGEVADDRSLWAVRASEERYRNLFHHLPYALIQVDSRPMRPIFEELRRQGVTDIVTWLDTHPELATRSREIVQVTDANRSAVELLGLERAEQLCGPVDFLFAASPEATRRVIAAHFDGCRNLVETIRLRTFDGRVRDVELSVTYPTPPDRLDVTILSLVDVTERLRTQAQLRQLEADYSRAARISMLGELATSIAHEINQPLSAIVTNAETSQRWLARDVPNLAKVRQLTARIAESGRRASQIVQRIRSMAARRAPERARLHLNEIIEEALLFVRHEIESRAIALSLTLARNLPAVLGDRVQLQQVMVNLLVNAVQAQGGGSGRIEITTAVAPSGEVLLTILDGGPGIAPENLDRIFGSFFTTKDEGIGIGLALCQSIIAAHLGSITAANHPQGGAVFQIALPAAAA